MATSAAPPSARNDVELGSVTHWPTVYAAAGVAAFLVAVLIAGGVFALSHTAVPPETAEATAEARPGPPPRPAGVTRQFAVPAPAPTAPSQPPEWKPLAPPPIAVSLPTAVKPLVSPPEVFAVAVPAPSPPPAVAPVLVVRDNEERFSIDLQAKVRTIDLDTASGTTEKLLEKAAQRRFFEEEARAHAAAPNKVLPASPDDSVVTLIARRTDLAGLPVRGESECRAPADAAKSLQELSRLLRRAQSRADFSGRASADSPINVNERDRYFVKTLAERKEWLKDEYAPGLAQVLCVETTPVRLQLTNMLGAIKGRNAGVALARQALFDNDPQVRQAAIEALKDRPCDDFRRTLLDGFRYPLPTVADRAAEALTAVNDRGAVTTLKNLLDQPDPSAPALDAKKKWVVAEVVKVNHLRNCLLCHAPSTREDDPVRGFVPKVGQEIPVAYYAQPEGDFVRADVTYLRQDFSAMEDVADPGKWPVRQRFDYLVRRRELTEQEVKDKADAGGASLWYPQRKAVRSALERLTASDAVPRPVAETGLNP